MAGKLCFLVLMNSPRKGAGRPTVLLDMRPLQGPSGGRGVGAYARGLLGGLIRAGFDSHMTLLLDVAFDEPDLPPGGYRLAGCRRRSHGQLAAYEDAVALTADIQRIAPDVYHAIDFHLPGRSPRPMVVTLHDLIPWAWGGPRMRGERLRYMAAFRLLRRADAVIAVSKATAEDAARLRVAARQRVRVISEAAPNMPGAVQAGRVDDGSLADLYSAAGCLVFPSRYEGFGLPCLEAMACGCPVAAFRNSSLPEVVDEVGMLVEDGDGNALGAAAAAMIGQRERWSRAGLRRARNFSWDKAARETIAVYESLIKA